MNSNQSKGELMKAIMSNRRSSDMFRNAFKSPLGSTSRTTAQRVFNIMNKLQSKRDGAGGPGMMPQIQSSMPMEPQVQDRRNMVVFHKLPPINIKYGNKKDGSGGPGLDFSNINLSSLGVTPSNLPSSYPLWSTPSNIQGLSTPGSSSAPANWWASPTTGIVSGGVSLPTTQGTPPGSYLLTGAPPVSQPSGINLQTPQPGINYGNLSASPLSLLPPSAPPVNYSPYTPPVPQTVQPAISQPGANTEQYILEHYGPEVYQQTYGKPAPVQTGGAPETPAVITPPTPTLQAQVESAVGQSTGPLTFARNMMLSPTDVVTGGKSAAEAYEQNRLDLWGKYNVGGLQDQMVNTRAVGATLPTDLQDYIRGRDEYLNQTDQMINSYIDTMSKSDMSDPISRTKANDYLNYLYTLRGATNKRYIDYTNSAIDDFNAGLQTLNDQYTVALNGYQTELTSQNAITKDTYDTYYAALSDMYTNLEQAPLKQKQMELLNIQILGAQAQIIADAAAAKAQGSYLADASKLTGHITDTSGYILPGLSLVDTIKEYESLEPGMNAASIVAKYAEGVNRFLSTADGSKTQSGDEINFTKKLSTAQDAIEQFANLASEGLAAQNANTYALGQKYANDIAGKIASTIGGTLGNDEVAKSMTEVIQTLARSGFLSGGAPEKQDFIKDMTTKIGGTVNKSIADALPGIAEAIYNNYLEYIKSGGSAASFVQSLLYDTTSTTDRTNLVLSTPAQLAQKIGISYALSLLNQAGLSIAE